ncbi:Panacea domain-containing protein [Paracoccus tegillarcae]|uniref:Antitoxin SocA-like Panacea domain-containing protein n=1 Tax=Paracoccus tegillarcae TaxID=1529068 RepID=A0A2K9EHC5_9RHOB|nr:Panacea domain-containing protein [Paracoccus tegillarcae]AUH32727.1 hypothetical protein CUV01_04430 [Paracoccus tegillarcae]
MSNPHDARLLFSFPVDQGARKLKELIVYISDRCADDNSFGAIMLNKILYHSDFRAFERTARPITGTQYFKLPQGPAPKALLPVRRELIDEGAITLQQVPIGDYTQDRTIAHRKAALSLFSDDEIAIVDEVIEELRGMPAVEISEASHDVRWRALQMRDTMPYSYVALSNKAVTANEITRTEELKEKYNW